MESTGEADASAGMSRLFDGFSISTGSQDSGNQWGGFDGVTPVSQHQNLPIAESRQGQTDFDTAKHDPPVDIFDPLCGKAAGSDELKAKLTPNGFGNLLDLTNTPPAAEPVNQDLLLLSSKSSQNASHQPHPMGYSGLTGFHMNYSTGSSGLTGSTPSTWAQSSISSTVQGSRVPYVGPQALPLSSTSTVPLRLPKPSSQKGDFSFVGKSGKADAFSFVQDQMKARKKWIKPEITESGLRRIFSSFWTCVFHDEDASRSYSVLEQTDWRVVLGYCEMCRCKIFSVKRCW